MVHLKKKRTCSKFQLEIMKNKNFLRTDILLYTFMNNFNFSILTKICVRHTKSMSSSFAKIRQNDYCATYQCTMEVIPNGTFYNKLFFWDSAINFIFIHENNFIIWGLDSESSIRIWIPKMISGYFISKYPDISGYLDTLDTI